MSAVVALLQRTGIASLFGRVTENVSRVPLLAWVYLAVIAYVYKRIWRDVLKMGTRRKTLLKKLTLDLTADEETIAQRLVDPSKLSGGFSTVGGHEQAKKILEENVVWPFRHPELFEHSGSSRALPTGVLLHGLPGTGKTLLARALAKELDAFFLDLSIDQLFSKYVGESEKLAAAVFTLAAKLKNCIIFVDEIDSLLSTRTEADTAVYTHTKSIFLTNWDGLQQPCEGGSMDGVVVVGATNRMNALDDAVLRRLPVKIDVLPPDAAARRDILKLLLINEGLVRVPAPVLPANASDDAATEVVPAASQPLPAATEKMIAAVAAAAQGYTGSDLREVCKLVRTASMRETIAKATRTGGPTSSASSPPTSPTQSMQQSLQLPEPTAQLFAQAMENVPPSVPLHSRMNTGGVLNPGIGRRRM